MEWNGNIFLFKSEAFTLVWCSRSLHAFRNVSERFLQWDAQRIWSPDLRSNISYNPFKIEAVGIVCLRKEDLTEENFKAIFVKLMTTISKHRAQPIVGKFLLFFPTLKLFILITINTDLFFLLAKYIGNILTYRHGVKLKTGLRNYCYHYSSQEMGKSKWGWSCRFQDSVTNTEINVVRNLRKCIKYGV